ncbi:MAG: hypothetical protein HUU16_11860, partial [Candidatus Omnitrophica bacterium]|nr:hypothetical protein [Candidatus Omnitrophota bacterium]
KGHDETPILSATLAGDGKSVTLELEDFQPVMQLRIRYNMDAADGELVKGDVICTINSVPESEGTSTP